MSPFEIYKKEQYEVKEYLIAVEQVKMLGEKLKICYVKNGPNHFEECKELREKLWTKLHTHNYGAPGPARSVRRSSPRLRATTVTAAYRQLDDFFCLSSTSTFDTQLASPPLPHPPRLPPPQSAKFRAVYEPTVNHVPQKQSGVNGYGDE